MFLSGERKRDGDTKNLNQRFLTILLYDERYVDRACGFAHLSFLVSLSAARALSLREAPSAACWNTLLRQWECKITDGNIFIGKKFAVAPGAVKESNVLERTLAEGTVLQQ